MRVNIISLYANTKTADIVALNRSGRRPSTSTILKLSANSMFEANRINAEVFVYYTETGKLVM